MTETVILTLTPELVKKLNSLKTDDSVSYEEIIGQILDDWQDDDYLTDEDKKRILSSVKDIEEGYYYTAQEVRAMIDQKPE